MIALILLLNLIVATNLSANNDKKLNDDTSNLVNVEVSIGDLSQANNKVNNHINLLFTLNIEDKWHTYWKNPGDSGLPTDIQIETQDNLKVSDLIFCGIPEKLPFDDLANYGFSDKQHLIIKVSPENGKLFKQNSIKLKAKVSWLVCKEECIPQDTTINIEIQLNQKEALLNQSIKENDQLINILLSNLPKEKMLKNQKAIQDNSNIILSFDEILNPNVQFFPYQGGIFVHGSEQKIIIDKSSTKLFLELDEFRIEDPSKIEGILVYDNKAIEISVPISR